VDALGLAADVCLAVQSNVAIIAALNLEIGRIEARLLEHRPPVHRPAGRRRSPRLRLSRPWLLLPPHSWPCRRAEGVPRQPEA